MLTIRRTNNRSGASYLARENGNGMMGGTFDSGKATPPVVVYKGGGRGGDFRDFDSRQGSMESPRRDFMPYRYKQCCTQPIKNS